MNPTNNSYKNRGIFLSVAVICIVGISTYLGEMKSAPVPADSSTASNTTTTTTTNTAAQGTQTPPATKSQSISDDDGNDDDEDVGRASVVATKPVSTTPVKIPVVVQTPPVITQKQSVYKNGTYTATGSYMSPGGQDQISVTLTLANDIITSVSVTPTAGDHTSVRYQDRFVAGYKQYVIGKNIASVNLSNVSGSSLTPIGFNNALTQIKAQAKA